MLMAVVCNVNLALFIGLQLKNEVSDYLDNYIKNVIIINDFSYIEGGASKVAIVSANELAKEGLKVTLFTGVTSDDLIIDKAVNLVTLNQQDVLNDKNRLRAVINGLWNSNAKNKFKELLASFDKSETIIHVHTWTKALTSSPIREAIKQGYKVVFTMHDYFLVCPNGGFYDYNKREICHRKPLSMDCLKCNCDSRSYKHKIWRVLRQLSQKHIGKVPDTVKEYIYISEFSKNVLSKHLPGDANYHFVPNFVDIVKEQRVEVTENKGIVYIGRLSKEKGIDVLVDALKKVDITCTFIGDGDMKEYIESANLPNVRVTGWLDKEEVKKTLRMARAMVLPTLWYEGMPLSVLESLSQGVPTVVSNTSAAIDVVKNNENGIVFERANSEELAKCLEKVNNDEFIDRLSRKAYDDYWINPVMLDKHISILKSTYNDILKKGVIKC